MFSHKSIDLREITLAEYQKFHGESGLMQHSFTETSGFAEITKPLVYGSYESLLMDFSGAKSAKSAGVCVNHTWSRAKARELASENTNFFKWLVSQIEQAGFVQLSFKEHHHSHYIIFSRSKNSIASTYILIPGSKKEWYNWDGSAAHYSYINAMLVKEN